ncbi:MAG: FAD-dependent monooxygenase [Cyclobacteriaceae bacterium]|nr:FAD-dependent monooxygenase [Cyclobacteriaceae bacterium]
MKQVAIIGGGLGGLIAAIRLAKAGMPVVLFEKKTYPFHRVCGEYVSNETLPFLKHNGLFPEKFEPPSVSRFQLSAINGKSAFLPLDLGGFGISRYAFDHFLSQQARAAGVQVAENCEVSRVQFNQDRFVIQANDHTLEADVVVGAFGKRSRLDVQLNRGFIMKRSPYVGIKYHIKTNHPDDLIALHNFNGGYLGISNVEAGKTNLCYLVHRNLLKHYHTIPALEENVLFKNPHIKNIYANSTFLFEKPEVINEFSFAPKEPVYNHLLMVGDSAGMITPLCGNGMAMAIHAAKLATDLVLQQVTEKQPRKWLEKSYQYAWKKKFAGRLRYGRWVQHYLFGSHLSSDLAIRLALYLRPIARLMIKQSHGEPF